MHRLAILFSLSLSWLLLVPSVSAQEEPRPTALIIEAPSAVPVGERFSLVARLSGPNGEIYGAVENEVLQLLIDGQHYRRERTNFAGAARFVVSQPLTVGHHILTVVYPGSTSLAPAAATHDLIIAPAILEIETVPALPGILVRAGEREFRTEANGKVQIPFQEPGSYLIEVSRSLTTPVLEARFARWNDDVFTPTRTVVIPKHRRLQVGYDTAMVITYRFVDLDGQPVDPARIERLVLKSSTGELRELPPAAADPDTRKLQASRALPTHAGLVSAPVQWSVEIVSIRGTNVVNRKQQRFYPIEHTDWTITLLLYSASFTVRDAFFGLPVGRAVRLIYPDGSSELVPLRDGQGVIRALPRGDYRVQATGVFGWSPPAPLALSRNQDVEITVLSGLDLLAIGVLGLALLAALLLAGRPHLWRLRRPRSTPASSPETPVSPENRIRRLALMTTLGLALFGTIFLTQGLARSDRAPVVPVASSSPHAPEPPATPTPQRAVTTPVATPVTPSAITIAPEFEDFWLTNGGLAAFGPPTAPPRWATAEDGSHVLQQDFTLARLEYRPEFAGTPYAIQLARIGVDEARALGLLDSPPFQRQDPTKPPAPDCTYFTQTGHWTCGVFRSFWRRHGLDLGDPGVSVRESLALLGYPISEAFLDETGRLVQYFERARLVSYPELRGTANEVIRDPIARRAP